MTTTSSSSTESSHINVRAHLLDLPRAAPSTHHHEYSDHRGFAIDIRALIDHLSSSNTMPHLQRMIVTIRVNIDIVADKKHKVVLTKTSTGLFVDIGGTVDLSIPRIPPPPLRLPSRFVSVSSLRHLILSTGCSSSYHHRTSSQL